ncbi:MAG: S8 family serine peptidase [Chloroflexia bacterium]
MTFIYSATRKKVQITLSTDDVGVRFEAPSAAAGAVRATRAALTGTPQLHESSPRSYGRVMLLHQPGAADAAFAAVRDALPARFVRNVQHTLPVYIEQQSGLRMVSTSEITVRFKAGATAAKQNKVLADLNLTMQRPNEFAPNQYIVALDTAGDESATLETANTLSERDDVVDYAAPNFVSEHRKAAATNDRLLKSQWHLNNAGTDGAVAGEDVDAFLAWDITSGGSPDIVIAIVDDGVDIEHPDLKANTWVNPNPNAPDRNGRNFYDGNFNPNPFYFHQPFDQMEGNDIHGTACAGVAAAVGNNKRGVAGIAYNCKILPVKIFGADALAPNDRVADAIRYAGLHAQVISCSWHSPWNPDVESAIDDVFATGRGGKGTLVFCATGNESQAAIGFPAAHPRAFGVGASNDQGVRAQYSNFGKGTAFVAPSSDPALGRLGITTTDVSIPNRGFNLKSGYTNGFGGTSSATPLAAGIAALVLSVNPSLTWSQVRTILRSTAEKIDAQHGNYHNGISPQYGYGRLNAFQAVKRAHG